MLQITPQMKILVAVDAVDFRKGIDGLVQLCKESLQQDPFTGAVFVFRNRRGTALKALVYDGQGFWLCHKRLSNGHFGWWPSFVNELAKWSYWEPTTTVEEMSGRLAARDFGPEGGPLAVEAWRIWSEAFRNYVPTNEDQYGPYRVGPAYPLLFQEEPELFPSAPYAHFGRDILSTHYNPHKPEDLDTEISLTERMAAGWDKGIAKLERAVALAFDTTGMVAGTYPVHVRVANTTPYGTLNFPITLTVVETYDVSLAPAAATQSGAPGAPVTYTFTVTNAGLAADTFSAALSGGLWEAAAVEFTTG